MNLYHNIHNSIITITFHYHIWINPYFHNLYQTPPWILLVSGASGCFSRHRHRRWSAGCFGVAGGGTESGASAPATGTGEPPWGGYSTPIKTGKKRLGDLEWWENTSSTGWLKNIFGWPKNKRLGLTGSWCLISELVTWRNIEPWQRLNSIISTLFGEINIYIAIFGKRMNIHKSKSFGSRSYGTHSNSWQLKLGKWW